VSATTTAAPGYRLDPLDRGLVGRLGRRQLVVLGVGATCWLLASISGAGFVPGVIAFGASWVVSVPRFGGQVIAEWLPIWCGWTLRGRWSRHWVRPLHLTSAGLVDDAPSLPPWLGGLRILAHPTEKWAAIHDVPAQTLTVHLQICGTGFTTLSADQMSMLLTGWGSVFQAVPADDGVVRITWSDIARRMPLVGHQQWVNETGADHDALDDYRRFVDASTHMRHDLVLTVTMRVGSLKSVPAQQAAFERVAEAARIVRDSLGEARLDSHGPLQAGEIAYLLRAGLSPQSVEPAGGTVAGSLVQRLGLTPTASAGPMSVDATSKQVSIDDVIHRCFWVESWPERLQSADWFDSVISSDVAGVVQRIFTLIVEPLDDAKAMSEIRMASSRHGGEQLAAAEGRTRWDSFKAIKASAVNEREREMASGHSPVAYTALVTVTVGDPDELNRAAQAMRRRCERHRVMLRPLWGRMDVGVAAALPLGLGLSREPF
jgi:hypothetical protein